MLSKHYLLLSFGCPPVNPSVTPSVCPPVCPSVTPFVCPHVYLSVTPSVCLPFCPSVMPFVCQSVVYNYIIMLVRFLYILFIVHAIGLCLKRKFGSIITVIIIIVVVTDLYIGYFKYRIIDAYNPVCNITNCFVCA